MSVTIICRYVCCDMNGFLLKSNMHLCDIRLSVKTKLIYNLLVRSFVVGVLQKGVLKIFHYLHEKTCACGLSFCSKRESVTVV